MTELLVLSSFIFPVGAIALIVLVVAAVSGRGEPDPTGRRPYAAYLFVLSFLALFTLVFAGFAMVSSLVDLATRDSDDSIEFEDSSGSTDSDSSGSVTGFIRDPETGEIIPSRGSQSEAELSSFDDEQDNENIRSAVQSGLVTLIAGLVLAFHAGKALRLVDEPGFLESPSRRLYQGYLYAVCFVTMLTALGALAAAGYGGFKAVAPGIAASGGDDETREGLAELASSGFLALAALLIFSYHWRRAERVLSPPGATAVETAIPPAPRLPPSPPPPPPPPPPEPDPETWAPRPPD
ncbi:MAG TPA: hypothetical protein VM121_09415 [Acidimicrobiales bacterium]|nr:hypothetical protein [Acidimicrobiales bacterium]